MFHGEAARCGSHSGDRRRSVSGTEVTRLCRPLLPTVDPAAVLTGHVALHGESSRGSSPVRVWSALSMQAGASGLPWVPMDSRAWGWPALLLRPPTWLPGPEAGQQEAVVPCEHPQSPLSLGLEAPCGKVPTVGISLSRKTERRERTGDGHICKQAVVLRRCVGMAAWCDVGQE